MSGYLPSSSSNRVRSSLSCAFFSASLSAPGGGVLGGVLNGMRASESGFKGVIEWNGLYAAVSESGSEVNVSNEVSTDVGL